jgi:hypothetical protein
VAQFEIRQEGDSLSHTDVTVSLEAHICNRATWVNNSNDVLRDDVQARQLQVTQKNNEYQNLDLAQRRYCDHVLAEQYIKLSYNSTLQFIQTLYSR